MKKIITCGIAATLCALALSTQAFATDITEDMSIFVENPEEFVATIKGWPGDNTFLDPKTIMPIYYADTNDYIATGKLIIKDVNPLGRHIYISDLIDGSGNFLGVISSSENDDGTIQAGQFYSEYSEDPMIDEKCEQCSSIDFRLYSEEVKDLLLANNISPDVKDVKLLSFPNVGVAYYINNGTDEVLVRAKGVERIYNWYADSDIVVLNEQLRQKVAAIQAEKDKAYEDFKDKYGDDAYVAGGNDSKPDNPYTGSDTSKHTAALAVELGLISAMIIGGAVVSKRRKNDR